MPFNNEEIAEIAREAANDIRYLLRLSAIHDNSQRETDSFNILFAEILAKLDKLGDF